MRPHDLIEQSGRARLRGAAAFAGAAVVAGVSLASAQSAPPVPAGSALTVNAQGQTVIVTPPGVDPDGGAGGGGNTDTPSTGADIELPWHTIDGGGRTYMAAADLEFGTTVGQPDAGASSGECFTLTGGFWAVTGQPDCYANCDHSVQAPILNVADFTCFLQRYAAGDCYANCDDSVQAPYLNVADFTCFLQKYSAGCP